jgi:hypothetical protein
MNMYTQMRDGNTNSRERDSSVERTLVTAVCRLGGGSIPQTRHSHYFSVSFSSTSVSAWRIGCVLVAYTAVRTRALASRRFDFVRYGVTTLYCLLEKQIFILELEAVVCVCVCDVCDLTFNMMGPRLAVRAVANPRLLLL